jgi:hypothetical protein
MLFAPGARFPGLPRGSFELFGIRDRDQRRHEIVTVIHPALERLAEDLLEKLNAGASRPLHPHLPRLDWPREYQPFCTWLALSREVHGYQAGPQLNVGVHPTEVAIRLGWDTAADAFGRFEFLCRHGHVGEPLRAAAAEQSLRFRVFASAPWPKGSELAFDSASDLEGSFETVRRRGVWWEAGRAYPLPQMLERACSPDLGLDAARIFGALLPVYERIAGPGDEERGASP